MRKLLKLLTVSIMLLLISTSVYAYNVVDLPESMKLADAMGIFGGSEIKSATISNVEDGQYITLSNDEIKDFYYAVSNMTVYRSINPTPFRGTAINLYTDTDVVSYYVGSGIQIGLFGDNNYVCYKVAGDDEVFLTYIDTMYRDSEAKTDGEEVHIATNHNFLKMPSAEWSQVTAKLAAEKNLIPYNLINKYSANISREEFCILMGQLITVVSEYKDLESYVINKTGAYLKGIFADCEGKDSSIDMMYALGIINGKGNNNFDPDGTLSREEAAKILTAVAEQFVYINTNKTLSYSDNRKISQWAYYPVQWVTDNDIMKGLDNNEFSPNSYYTVEQAITTASRMYDYLKRMIV